MDNGEIKTKISLDVINNKNVKIDNIKFQKMLLLYNALEEGWTIKKRDDLFIFKKKHECKKEILLDNYLERFMKSNLDINKIL
jgi:hypothetical protein